jgi:hypothetical protein
MPETDGDTDYIEPIYLQSEEDEDDDDYEYYDEDYEEPDEHEGEYQDENGVWREKDDAYYEREDIKNHDYIYRTHTVNLERFDHPEGHEMAYGLHMHSNFLHPETWNSPQRHAYVIIGSYKELVEIHAALTKAIAADGHKYKPESKESEKPFNRFADIDIDLNSE